MRKLLFLFSILVFTGTVNSQSGEDYGPPITLSGVVKDGDNGRIITNLMLINMRTRQGIYAGATGPFSVALFQKDTLFISAPGYNNFRISFADSVRRPNYTVEIFLHKITIQLKEVTVFAPRDLQQIESDIQKLGYQKSDYVNSGVDAISSPITFLYQQFSRRERAKRDIAEKRNEDKRRELLKELLAKYAAQDIIQLKDEKFDSFIDFCNVNDAFLQSCTQYEFIMFVKKKYEFYRFVERRR